MTLSLISLQFDKGKSESTLRPIMNIQYIYMISYGAIHTDTEVSWSNNFLDHDIIKMSWSKNKLGLFHEYKKQMDKKKFPNVQHYCE